MRLILRRSTLTLGISYINAEVTQRFSSAPHVFESATGLLITSVSIDSGADLISMNFNVVSASPNVIIRANAESAIPRRDSFDHLR